MSAYPLLFSISIEHQFFSDSDCKKIQLAPTTACLHQLKKIGLFPILTDSGISIFCEPGNFKSLREYVAESHHGLTLGFKLISTDFYFDLYTRESDRAQECVRYFDSRRVFVNNDGRQMLHEDGYASDKDYKQTYRKLVTDALSPHELLIRPSALIQILLTDDDMGLCWPDGTKSHQINRDFCIRFEARKTYWKYFLFGDLVQREVYIKDQNEKNEQVNFHEVVEVRNVGNVSAKLFMSEVTMPMQEVFERNFQLKERGGLSEKVLIKRMPNACMTNLNREVVDVKGEARKVLVSEIYINQ